MRRFHTLLRLVARPMVFIGITSLILAACNDTATGPARSPRQTTPFGPASADAATDPGINYGDTWLSTTDIVAESTTVSSSQPFLDPTTQQYVTSLVVGTEPETVSVVAGYGYDAQPRVTTGFNAPNALGTSLIRQVGPTTYDASGGQALAYGTFDVEPIASLGPLANEQIDPTDPCADAIDRALCEAGLDRSVTNVPRIAGPAGTASAVRVGSGIARLQLDATHLRTVEDLPSLVVPSTRTPPGKTVVTAPDQQSRRTRDFEKRGPDWVISHMMDEIFEQRPQGSVRHVMHHHMVNLVYSRNRALDEGRKHRRAVGKSVPTLTALQLRSPTGGALRDQTTSCDAAAATLIVACDQPVSGVSDPYGDPPPHDQSIVGTADISVPGNGGTTALALQHGFISDGSTWDRMQSRLRTQVLYAKIVAPTTAWPQPYETQAQQLKANIQAQLGSTPTVLVGHSNGGMISRYLAQTEFGHGPLDLRGVITIGSPHWGSPLATAARGINGILGIDAAGAFLTCVANNGQAGCRNFMHAITSGTVNYWIQAGGDVPVLDEMHWHSDYHTIFNSVPETFPRFGISSSMWSKWVFWRQYGDTYCYEDTIYCGGSAQVAKIDKIFHHDITCAVISSIFISLHSAANCVADAVFLRAVDNLFVRYLAPPGEPLGLLGDGVVPYSSQQYPNVPAENLFTVTDGPHHTGETSDPRVMAFVARILRERLLFPSP